MIRRLGVAAVALVLAVGAPDRAVGQCVVGTNAALSFDGTTDFVTLPNSPQLGGFADFTFEFWFRTTNARSNIASCSSARMSATRSPAERVRIPSSSSRVRSVASAGSSSSAPSSQYRTMSSPPRRPNTTMSSSEFVPSRFAPCTETHAHSPAAYRPGTTVSSAPSTTLASTSVGIPPIA